MLIEIQPQDLIKQMDKRKPAELVQVSNHTTSTAKSLVLKSKPI